MKRIVALLLAALVMVAMLAISGVASAKIRQVCENPGGGEPQGQCQGQALTKEARNPAGHAPPGQN